MAVCYELNHCIPKLELEGTILSGVSTENSSDFRLLRRYYPELGSLVALKNGLPFISLRPNNGSPSVVMVQGQFTEINGQQGIILAGEEDYIQIYRGSINPCTDNIRFSFIDE